MSPNNDTFTSLVHGNTYLVQLKTGIAYFLTGKKFKMAKKDNTEFEEEDRPVPAWMKDMPEIKGDLEISRCVNGIFIGGDPVGLRSLGSLLTWLANLDQTVVPGMPDGERYHVHLRPCFSVELQGPLTPFSDITELCRLDAKGTGAFPDKYAKAGEHGKESDPEELQRLRELTLKDVELPDYVYLVYAVCACHKEACGWGGWIIDSAFKITGKKHPTGTGDKTLPAKIDDTCPVCGRELYATSASLRLAKCMDN